MIAEPGEMLCVALTTRIPSTKLQRKIMNDEIVTTGIYNNIRQYTCLNDIIGFTTTGWTAKPNRFYEPLDKAADR